MTLVERIKKVAKEKRGWNLKTTAQNAGIGINSIYRWKDQTPTIESLNKVAVVLGVSVDYLLGKTDNATGNVDDNSKPVVDLNKDDAILTFDGKPIPDQDMEIIKRLLGK